MGPVEESSAAPPDGAQFLNSDNPEIFLEFCKGSMAPFPSYEAPYPMRSRRESKRARMRGSGSQDR